MLFVGQKLASRTTIRIAAAAAGRIHFLHTISVGREHIKLDADPQHQRNAAYAAEIIPGSFVHQEQYRRRQIGNAVDDQQREARKCEVLKQDIRKREHLK